MEMGMRTVEIWKFPSGEVVCHFLWVYELL
jgi:hypothetical protein